MANTTTEVRLMNVPLENDYKHTIYFGTKTEQEHYFETAEPHLTERNLTYIRKDNVIRFPRSFDDLIGKYNYVAYKNPAYSNKMFYAFITNMEYINDSMTAIHIETDVIQTWHFDYVVRPSFVEREHVVQDRPGLHTVPEQLELGDYMCYKKHTCNLLDTTSIVVGSTVNLDGAHVKGAWENLSFENVGGGLYGKTYSGVEYWAYPVESFGYVNNVLENLANKGKSDAITCIFMCPDEMLNVSDTFRVHSHKIDPLTWNLGLVADASGGYTPVNKKLMTYPYRYLLVTNHSGSSAIYKYELFNNYDSALEFDVNGAITPGYSCRLTPKSYNGVEKNYEEGLSLGKYPICNWNTDVYTNWLTQNSVNISTSLVSNAIGGVASLLTLQGDGVVAGLTGIANTMGEVYKHSLEPPQAEGNINSGDVTFASGNLKFTAYAMGIRYEFMDQLDGFFNMFGYKVNTVKIPNKNHRLNYWYTKTIDVSIDGGIPSDDMKKIKNCYNSGITFWKIPAYIGDYSVSNIPLI